MVPDKKSYTPKILYKINQNEDRKTGLGLKIMDERSTNQFILVTDSYKTGTKFATLINLIHIHLIILLKHVLFKLGKSTYLHKPDSLSS